jgi:hypothetical protein
MNKAREMAEIQNNLAIEIDKVAMEAMYVMSNIGVQSVFVFPKNKKLLLLG